MGLTCVRAHRHDGPLPPTFRAPVMRAKLGVAPGQVLQELREEVAQVGACCLRASCSLRVCCNLLCRVMQLMGTPAGCPGAWPANAIPATAALGLMDVCAATC